MQRFRILHRTYYNFTAPVRLEPHTLRLRPREGHELRIEASVLDITPSAVLRWHRDVEDNSVAVATFAEPASQLTIESEVIIQQYNLQPLDFLVAEHAVQYPFVYDPEERAVLAPYLGATGHTGSDMLNAWIGGLYRRGERIETYELMQRLTQNIHGLLSYRAREEPGVQPASETLRRRSGSCRDAASLFIEVARRLGLAARFVSGYLYAAPADDSYGATHAWAEVFLPGAGWKGFDPTTGDIVGSDHIAVAVARLPELVPPVAGTYVGAAQSLLDVGVWVTPLDQGLHNPGA